MVTKTKKSLIGVRLNDLQKRDNYSYTFEKLEKEYSFEDITKCEQCLKNLRNYLKIMFSKKIIRMRKSSNAAAEIIRNIEIKAEAKFDDNVECHVDNEFIDFLVRGDDTKIEYIFEYELQCEQCDPQSPDDSL